MIQNINSNKYNNIIQEVIYGSYKTGKPSKEHYQFCQNNLDNRNVYSINQIYNSIQKQLIFFTLLVIIISIPIVKASRGLSFAKLGPKVI